MEFMDPMPVTCPQCEAPSKLRVADLLGLRAICPACGFLLKDIGLQMREATNDWWAFCTWAEVLNEVDHQVGCTIDDAEVFQRIKDSTQLTLADMVNLVAHQLESGTGQPRQSVSLVLKAALKATGKNVGMEALKLPILEALAANRWKDR